MEVDGRPFLQIRPRGGNGRRAGVGEWEVAADLARGGRAGLEGNGRRRLRGRRRRGGSELEHGTARVLREGQGEEKRSRFRKSGALLAISDTLRATGDRGSAFATRP